MASENPYLNSEEIVAYVDRVVKEEISFPFHDIDIYDYLEKLLFCSALMIDFNPQKEMKSKFMYDYLISLEIHLLRLRRPEEWYRTFEGAQISCSFRYSSNKESEGQAILINYITQRLMMYKWLLNYYEDKQECIKMLFFLINRFSLDCGHFCSIDDLELMKTYSSYETDPDKACMVPFTDHESFPLFVDWTKKHISSINNLIRISKESDFYRFPSERFHTEERLASLRISSHYRYLSFSRICSKGVLQCKKCNSSYPIVSRNQLQNITVIGRQCPHCGQICTETIKNEDFHEFSILEDFKCPSCDYIIRKKGESVFKGDDNPIFCPHCRSVMLTYVVNS